MLKKYNDYNEQILLEQKEILGNFVGVDSALNKVMSYNKRLLNYNNSANESYYFNNNQIKDVYFSTLEREGIKNVFEEFIPKVADAFINELNEGGYEFDESIFNEIGLSIELNEGIKDRIAQAMKKISSTAKSLADKAGEKIDDVHDYIEDAGEKIKKAPKELINKYKNTINFIKKLIDEGIKTVKEFISNVAKLFEKIGGCVKEALNKLGLFKEDEKEDNAEVSVNDELIDGMTENDGEKNFLYHIIAYMSIMLGSNKETTEKLIGEGYENIQINLDDELNEGVIDTLANNKVLQFIFQYGKGKHISIWKSIMISITGSLIISLGLPVILPICGVSVAAVPTICAAVRLVWSMKGCFKILMNRYLNRKPGEKFFDTKTCVLLAISILPQIPPFKDWISDAFGKVLHWLGIDKWLEDISKSLGELIKDLHGKDPDIKIISQSWDEHVTKGGSVIGYSGEKSNDLMSQHAEKMGFGKKALDTLDKLLNGGKDIHGSMKLHKFWDNILDNNGNDLPKGFIQDTRVPGVNAMYHKAAEEIMQQHPELLSGPIGGEEFYNSVNGAYGDCNIIMNCSDEVRKEINDKFVKMGGKLTDLNFTDFGHGIINNVVHHDEVTAHINWLLDTITKSFGVTFYPWFDKNTFGKYKIRFASATRGSAAYVVKDVKMQNIDEIGTKESSNAFNELQELHKSAWEKYKKNLEDTNKDDKKKLEIPDEPKYIVFYVDPNEDTGNENDKPKNQSDNNKGIKMGIVIDPISMMIADVCDFGENSSAKIRRRPHPYFMKGLFSRISFIPVKSNDNETKDFIRTSLGETMRNLILSNITFGNGAGYVSASKENKDEKLKTLIDKNGKEIDGVTYEVSDPNFLTNEKVDEGKELIDMGNLSPKEAVTCLNDKKNKEAYDLLDGKYASNISISSKNGKTSIKAKKNNNTIENIHYYEISESEYKDLCEKNDKKNLGSGKKKSSPRGIVKLIVDGKPVYYRRLSQSLMKKDKLNLNDDQKLTWAYVHIRPLLTDGKSKIVKGKPEIVDKTLPEELKNDKKISKLLYTDGKINDKVFKILDPFLYRPEKTFAKDDEHELSKLLKEEGVEGEKLGMFKKIFKNEEQIHETFKKMIEMIWDYLSENRRTIFKKKDNIKNHIKENYEYDEDNEIFEEEYTTIFDELIAESLFENYDDEEEIENDMYILNERNKIIPSFNRFLIENYK